MSSEMRLAAWRRYDMSNAHIPLEADGEFES